MPNFLKKEGFNRFKFVWRWAKIMWISRPKCQKRWLQKKSQKQVTMKKTKLRSMAQSRENLKGSLSKDKTSIMFNVSDDKTLEETIVNDEVHRYMKQSL